MLADPSPLDHSVYPDSTPSVYTSISRAYLYLSSESIIDLRPSIVYRNINSLQLKTLPPARFQILQNDPLEVDRQDQSDTPRPSSSASIGRPNSVTVTIL